MKKILSVISAPAMQVSAFAETPVPENGMEAVLDYWPLMVAAVAVLAVGVIWVIKFIRTPREKQFEKLRGWLLWVVCKAEAEFGSKTGEIKLSYVYDLFVARFPWLAKLIPFAVFKEKVDEALDSMAEMLKKDPQLLEKVPSAAVIAIEDIEAGEG